MRRSSSWDRADVVIIGGGIVGLSLAWHLRQLGIERVVVLERGQPGQQSTGVASGGIRRQFGTRLEIEMTLTAWRFYERVLSDPDYTGTFERSGYTFLAGSQEIDVLTQALTLQQDMGIPVRWLDSSELAEMLPYCDLRGVIGGTFCGEDGFINPWEVVRWLLGRCRALGVRILNQTPVIALEISETRVRAVRTDDTTIDADVIVNAAGAWAGSIGSMAGVNIPVVPSPRVKFVTGPGPDFPADTPLIVDLPTGAYFRSHRGRANVGVKPESPIVSFCVDVNTDLLAWMAERACERFPTLLNVEVRGLIKGLYELTPDGLPLAGPVAGVPNFYVAAGFNGHGIMHGPPVARAVAELIATGRSETLDLEPLRPDRFDGRTPRQVYNLL